MTTTDEWHQTACILCSVNCGIEVRLDGRRFARIRGDKAHPTSRGYTCEFWVDGQLFGRPRCHTTGDYERAEAVVFVGKNPWQSHGFPRARTILKEIARDDTRAMVVIDPRRTETAELADFYLQVRPGADAWLLAAMLAVLAEEDLFDHAWLDAHAARLDELLGLLGTVDIAAYCERAGVDEALVRAATRRIAAAQSVSIFEDLGVQ